MSLNKTTLIGHLGADPEIRYMPDGTATATVSVATTDKWKDKTTKEPKEKTEWHRVVFFGKLAEVVGEYVKKGSQIYVEGKLRTRKWKDNKDIERYTTEIVANELQMLDKKPAAEHDTYVPPAGNQPTDFEDDTPPF